MRDLDKFDFSTALDKVLKSTFNDVFIRNLFEEKPSIEQFEGFEEKDGKYEYRHDFGKNAQKSDIRVRLENESELEISYYHKYKNSVSSFKFTETLPQDAISEALKATINDGVLVVSVDKEKEQGEMNKKEKREIPIK